MSNGPVAARLLFALAVALTLGACQDNPPTGPQPTTVVPVPQLSVTDAPPPAPNGIHVVLPLPAGDPPFTTNVNISLNSYATSTLVEIRIEGVVTAHKNYPPEDYGKTYASLDPSGWLEDGFFAGCYVQASVRYSGKGSFYPGNGSCPWRYSAPYPGSRPSWVDTVVVRGTGTASRTYGIPYWGSNCNNGPCYYYTGSQTITVTPIATTLALGADPVDGPAGRTVTYTATASDGNTVTVKAWNFVPDDTTTVQVERVGQRATGVHLSVVSGSVATDSGGLGPCVAPATTCQGTVTESGTMYVLATVLGVDQQAKVHVTVDTCDTTDPLNQQWLRDSLDALLEESNADAATDQEKLEHAAYLVRDRASGTLSYHRSDPDPEATNCSVLTQFDLDTARYELIATIHTHPYTPGDTVHYCGTKRREEPYRSGGSADDWASLLNFEALVSASQPDTKVKEYIIDKVNLIELDSGKFLSSGPAEATKIFPRSTPTCG
jgi:hypothetical protein